MACIGFLGRTMENSNVKYKVKINDMIEAIGSSGIKLLKLAKCDANELANQEWKLSNLSTETNILVPHQASFYENMLGETIVRFTDYISTHPDFWITFSWSKLLYAF